MPGCPWLRGRPHRIARAAHAPRSRAGAGRLRRTGSAGSFVALLGLRSWGRSAGLVAMDTIGLDLRKRERFVDAIVLMQPAPACATTASRQVKRVLRGIIGRFSLYSP